jgi:hypothetical protein
VDMGFTIWSETLAFTSTIMMEIRAEEEIDT